MDSRSFTVTLFFTALLSISGATQAQEDADSAAVAATTGVPSAAGAMSPGWRNQYGVGFIANPKFVGSDEYDTRIIPYVDFRYFDENGTRFFANVPQGIGGYLYRQRDFASGHFLSIGASIAPGFNVRDDSIEGLEEVGIATEARLLVEGGGRRWAASATFAQDLGSGHEGAYLDFSVALRGRVGQGSGFYAVGPVLRFGDTTYKDNLFGVSPDDAINSGLPEYKAESGVERFGIQGLLSLPVMKTKWRWTSVARASQLFDNAADSPIVIDETQFFFITSLTRSF
ncbi:MAG: MipA/OmpV family protein [Pseudomonadota bacterium]